jgi:DNA-binding transcriptional regulator YdaS (Cro superfamily)
MKRKVVPALRLLEDELDRRGWTKSHLARLVGVAPPSVHKWFIGEARPVDVHRAIIERITEGRVPSTSWRSDDERVAVYSATVESI